MSSTILPPIDEVDGVLDELQTWFLARAESALGFYVGNGVMKRRGGQTR